jgi:hypothetical protein
MKLNLAFTLILSPKNGGIRLAHVEIGPLTLALSRGEREYCLQRSSNPGASVNPHAAKGNSLSLEGEGRE